MKEKLQADYEKLHGIAVKTRVVIEDMGDLNFISDMDKTELTANLEAVYEAIQIMKRQADTLQKAM